jgi:hypothetical protein
MSTITVGGSTPSNINTLERQLAWGGLLFSALNPTLAVNEVEGATAERIAQAGIFRDANGDERLLLRLSIPIDSSYRSDNSKKLWMFASEVSNIVVPTAYTTN